MQKSPDRWDIFLGQHLDPWWLDFSGERRYGPETRAFRSGKGRSGNDAVIQLLSCIQLSVTLWTVAHQASLSFTVFLSLLKLMSIESVMPSNHLILCHPLLLLPWTFPSINVFSNESALHIRWPKYWSISSPNEYSGLISFTIDWLDLLAVHGTLQSLLQHHSSKASILRRSAFFTVHLACCNSWGRKESDTTERLNWIEPLYILVFPFKCVWIFLFVCFYLGTHLWNITQILLQRGFKIFLYPIF